MGFKVKPICQRGGHEYARYGAYRSNELCGLVQYYGAAHSQGLKPLIGADLWVWGDYPEGEIFCLTALA